MASPGQLASVGQLLMHAALAAARCMGACPGMRCARAASAGLSSHPAIAFLPLQSSWLRCDPHLILARCRVPYNWFRGALSSLRPFSPRLISAQSSYLLDCN